MPETDDINAAMLQEILKHGGRIDASSLVLDSPDARLRVSDARWGAHLAANMMAANELEPYGAWEARVENARRRHERSRALGNEDAAPFDPNSLGMGLRQFEALSLGARIALAIHESERAAVSTPGAHRHRKVLELHARRVGLNLKGFRVVYAEDILKALAWAADEVGPDQGRGGSAETQEQLAMRSGLQLVGCWIRSRSEDGVRLINARLPFSLRLIGCVIECPVLLAHCELVSLDLSGSALNSLDAGGLRASGSVHLRRTTIRTPVSFAGAHVAGVLNASDAVISPFRSLPKQIAIDPEHGMLNLSKITIQNEVRLERTRIWGGLSLRGASIGRSLHMNRAIVVSPLGLLEKWFAETVDDLKFPDMADQSSMKIRTIDAGLGQLLHSDAGQTAAAHAPDSRAAMEVMWGDPRLWRNIVDRTLKQLKPRAILSAVRADGLTIDGSFFARGLIASGRIRIKYARIGGSLRMEGALLRSAARCRRSVDELFEAWAQQTAQRDAEASARGAAGPGPSIEALTLRDRRNKWQALVGSESFKRGWKIESPEVALDVRGSELKGDLTLHCDLHSGDLVNAIRRTRAGPVVPRDKLLPAHVQGNILLRGLKAEGSVRMRGMVIEPEEVWPEQALYTPEPCKPEPTDVAVENKPLAILRLLLKATDTWIAGRWDAFTRWPRQAFRSPLWDREWFPTEAQPDKEWRTQREAAMRRARDIWSVKLQNATVGRDIDFRMTDGLFGVDLQNCRIGGDLSFSEKSSGRARSDINARGFIQCAERARNLAGTLSLRGAEIGGDAMLTFDPATGPIIKAEMTTVGGRLDIYPQPDASSYQLERAGRTEALEDARARLSQDEELSGFWLDHCTHPELQDTTGAMPVGRTCRACNLLVEKAEDHLGWYIDLRHASATVFGHPPAAWPDPGALSLDGFAYEQTSDLGPLAPQPPIEDTRHARWQRARTQYVWRRRPLRRALLGGSLWLAVLAVCLTAAWLLWMGTNAVTRAAAPALVLEPGLAYLTAAFVACLMLSLTMFTQPGLTLRLGRWPLVSSDEVAPRALEYLQRQRLTGNRFKWRPASYHVLDTYVRAAKSLREAGRYISANIVEEERLRRRTEMLSWRLHGPVKLAMKLVDLFAGYGFRLSRAFAWTGCFIFGVALLAHSAAAFGYLERQPQLTVVDGQLTQAAQARPACGPKSAATPGALQQDCPGLLYATDLVLPFIDLGEAGRWKPTLAPVMQPAKPQQRQKSRLDWLPEPLESLTAAAMLSWPSGVALLGLLFTAVMGAAAATRVESALARVEE